MFKNTKFLKQNKCCISPELIQIVSPNPALRRQNYFTIFKEFIVLDLFLFKVVLRQKYCNESRASSPKTSHTNMNHA